MHRKTTKIDNSGSSASPSVSSAVSQGSLRPPFASAVLSWQAVPEPSPRPHPFRLSPAPQPVDARAVEPAATSTTVRLFFIFFFQNRHELWMQLSPKMFFVFCDTPSLAPEAKTGHPPSAPALGARQPADAWAVEPAATATTVRLFFIFFSKPSMNCGHNGSAAKFVSWAFSTGGSGTGDKDQPF